MFLPLRKAKVWPKQVRADSALNGPEHRLSEGQWMQSTALSRLSQEFLEQLLLLALCWKGFWKTSCSRKQSLSEAYVISYLCLFVCNKIKIEWVVLTEQHRNSSWLEMEWAQLEHTQLQIHVKQFPGKSVIKVICINSCFSRPVERNTVSSRRWLWSLLSSLSDLCLLTEHSSSMQYGAPGLLSASETHQPFLFRARVKLHCVGWSKSSYIWISFRRPKNDSWFLSA